MLERMIIDTVEKLRLTSRNMPKVWDGRESILEMKDANFKYWKQMEWMDFYFKFLCQKHFIDIIDTLGKKYGITEFDAFREISWDFRVDSIDPSAYSVTANDAKAIADTLHDYGYYGTMLAIGDMEYDDEETTFKKWHDELRGKVSKYDTKKINGGIMSRTRKTEFILLEIHFVCFDPETLSQCSSSFQKGFRNADGSPRREKVTVNIRKVPNTALIATEIF